MNECDICVGSVVLSKQGRDKGNYFMVTAVGNGYVMLVDGGARKFGNPKKKNIKHVSYSGVKLESISQKLKNKSKVFDSEVKSALRQFSRQDSQGES